MEDAHWFDAGTEIFVTQAVEAIQGSRALAILNFRPEYSAPWMRKSYYRQISLAPLGPEAIKALLADLLGEHPSLNGLPDLIQERTAGNPFFIEEVVRSWRNPATWRASEAPTGSCARSTRPASRRRSTRSSPPGSTGSQSARRASFRVPR
jgi:hypothetical protein